jgi:EAL domain-containing protein (putative c-di-GMP-specific phosphodiesterase class I)
MILRLCLLTVIWGGVTFGSASVVHEIVRNRLPGLEGFVRSFVVGYRQALQSSSGTLDDLLADDRLHQAVTAPGGTDEAALHRVMYEYRYLHPSNLLMLYNAVQGTTLKVEGGPNVVPTGDVLARLRAGNGATWLSGSSSNPMLITARPLPNLPVGQQMFGLLGQPLNEVFNDVMLPALPTADKGQAVSAVLANRVGPEVWTISPGQPGRRDAHLAQADLSHPGLITEGENVFIIRPLPHISDWAVVIVLPLALVAASAEKIRTGLWVVAAVLSLLLFWQPAFRLARRGKPAQPAAQADATGQPQATPTPGGLLASIRRRMTALTGPLQRAVNRATLGESLLEPSMPPPPVGHGIVGGGGTAVHGLRTPSGSSVHQRARALAEEAPPPPTAEKDKAIPRLPDEEVRALVHQALEHDLLQLAYQPIYQTTDSMPALHEVYVRLPGIGAGTEAHNFLPQAAQLGLLPQIDAQVFRKVLATHFPEDHAPSTPLALNLAANTLEDLGYIEELFKIEDPRILRNIIFEVRSGELLRDPATLAYLRKCQNHGIRLAVDYFGGGKTMLEASKQLGFDFVKLDALHFWFDLPRRKELIGLSRVAAHLHLPLILEKIENNQMESMARKVGIPFLQGYNLRRPGPQLVTEQLQGWRGAVAQPAPEAAPQPAAPVEPSSAQS